MINVIIDEEGRMDDTRDRMLDGAIRLLATDGVRGASLGKMLAATGAPRGSIYHHFPGGRDQLFSEALERTTGRHDRWVEAHAGPTAESVAAAFLDFWKAVLEGSRFESGCPVLAVAVSAPDGQLFDKAGSVFASSMDHLAALFEERGVPRADAADFATVLVASAEGAVVLARLQRSLRPLELVAGTLLARARELDASPPGTARG